MKKSMSFVPFLMLVSLSVTGTQAAQMESDGKKMQTLSCNEFNTSLEECKARASKVCTNGHELVNHHAEVPADSGDGIYMHTTNHLVVRCL